MYQESVRRAVKVAQLLAPTAPANVCELIVNCTSDHELFFWLQSLRTVSDSVHLDTAPPAKLLAAVERAKVDWSLLVVNIQLVLAVLTAVDPS